MSNIMSVTEWAVYMALNSFFNIGERGMTVFRQQSQINLCIKPDIHLKNAGKTCVDLGI